MLPPPNKKVSYPSQVIAALTGTVLAATGQQLIVDVSGVGYLVYATPDTIRRCPAGQQVQLFTTLIVREDALTLFGFMDSQEQEVFDLLRSANGVGPKLALAILAALSLDAIKTAVALEDDGAFKAVSGIGPKTAKLLVVTLAGKFAGVAQSSAMAAVAGSNSAADIDAVSQALQGLGWNERMASEAVREAAAALGSQATRDNLLKTALARLGQSKTVSGSDQ